MHRTVVGGLLAVFLAGCSGDSVPELPKIEPPAAVKNVQQKVTNAVETVKQTASVAGNLELQAGAPLQTGGAYARLITMAGRDSVLQITSYNDMSNEQFPSVFVRGKVGGTTPAQLVGQEVHAQVFVQRQPKGPVLATAPGIYVQFKITQVQGNTLSGEFLPGGVLIDSQTRAEVPLSGKFTSTLQQ